jgi:hypothetical protein
MAKVLGLKPDCVAVWTATGLNNHGSSLIGYGLGQDDREQKKSQPATKTVSRFRWESPERPAAR